MIGLVMSMQGYLVVEGEMGIDWAAQQPWR